jgi:hypothetical protein
MEFPRSIDHALGGSMLERTRAASSAGSDAASATTGSARSERRERPRLDSTSEARPANIGAATQPMEANLADLDLDAESMGVAAFNMLLELLKRLEKKGQIDREDVLVVIGATNQRPQIPGRLPPFDLSQRTRDRLLGEVQFRNQKPTG